MRIETFITDSLGDASHVLLDNGIAAVLDPQRDIRPYLAAIERVGARLAYIFETHVHNDYISGGRELAALGAIVVAPADGNLDFPHRAVAAGDIVTVGGTSLLAFAAPGHTYEHTAYLATPDGGHAATAAFTGGSLLMGSAGRSDLLGPEHAEPLARQQWTTAHRLAGEVSADAVLYPTHGAGSFCSSSSSITDRFGALRTELSRNPALALTTVEAFIPAHLAPAPIPGYYRYMASINRKGPEVYGAPPVAAQLEASSALELIESGATALDLRAPEAFAAGHLRGSINIQHGPTFLAYVGWVLPFNAPLVLVSDSLEETQTATIDLFRIGYEQVRGVLLARDVPAGYSDRYSPASIDETEAALASRQRPVVDVRFAHEQGADPLDGAIRAPIEEIASRAESLPGGSLVVCETGYRSSIAASLMRAHGIDAVPTLGGGASTLRKRMTGGG